MRKTIINIGSLILGGALLGAVTLGCDKGKEEADKAAEEQAAKKEEAKAALEQAALKAKEQQEGKTAEAAQEPAKLTKDDLELTDERRTAIEAAVADAKGFLTASELEKQLQEKGVKDEGAAVAALDGIAKGKWILLAGTLNNVTEDSVEVPIVYTPQAANDPMGMSKQFFQVTVSGIEGLADSGYKGGQLGVFLAKYEGNKKASEGRDVVALGYWSGKAAPAAQGEQGGAAEEAAEKPSEAAEPAKEAE